MSFKDIIIDRKAKEIASNIFYLAFSQLINYIIPILMIPILLKRIGYENLGIIATYQAFFIYISIIIDFGFNLTSTAEVAKFNDDKDKIQNVFNSTTTSKLYLLIIGTFLIFPLVIIFFPKDKNIIPVIICIFLAGLGNVLFSEWLFQGLKKIKNQFIAIFFSKTVLLLIIYFFVISPNDYILVIYFDALSSLVAGLISATIIYKKLGYRLKIVSINEVIVQLRLSWYPFISNALTTLYTTGNILVLGYIAGQFEVSKFTVAQRSFFVINGMFSLLNRILYPYLSKEYSTSKTKYAYLISSFSKIILICSVAVSIILYLLAPYVIHFMTNEWNRPIILLFQILCLNFIFSPLNSLMTNMLVIEGKGNKIAQINFVGLFLSLTITLFLIYNLKSLGLVIGSLITNISLLFLCIKKTNFNYIIFKRYHYE